MAGFPAFWMLYKDLVWQNSNDLHPNEYKESSSGCGVTEKPEHLETRFLRNNSFVEWFSQKSWQ